MSDEIKRNISYRTLSSYVKIVYSMLDSAEETNKLILEDVTFEALEKLEIDPTELSKQLMVMMQGTLKIIASIRILSAKIGVNLPEEHTPRGRVLIPIIKELISAESQEDIDSACEAIITLENDESNYIE